MSVKEFFVLMLVCVIWGLHFVVMKYTVGNTAEPLFYAAVRMSIVAVLLAPKLKWHEGLMPLVIGAGLGFGALNYAFMFPALKFTTATAGAVTIELFVPFSIILSVIFLRERIGKFKIAGIVLAFLGVLLVATAKPDEAAGPYFLLGIILMMGAAMSEAVGAVIVKKVKGIGPLQLLAWFAIVGSVVLWTLTLTLERNQIHAFRGDNLVPFLLALGYSALLVSIVAHGSYYWLLQRLPISVVSTSGLMTTLVAVISSALILKEPLTPLLIVGGLMTLSGVALILWRNRLEKKALPPASV